ncbi:MAG: hypothetical protein J7M03_00110 [Candidatus Desulfofervidaceae bacterium]|nr:hypothetical protein [Candidatus Desulfofervidaceae bacterium]MDL1970412.1 hypothetical protein [Candidatus Desulfofervidaceae bacterium]
MMKSLPVLLFKKGPYLLASLAEDIESVEERKEQKFLKLKNANRLVAIDEVVDFVFLPLEKLYALPNYIKKTFNSESTLAWNKAIWGIIEAKGMLFTIVNLKILAEEAKDEVC